MGLISAVSFEYLGEVFFPSAMFTKITNTRDPSIIEVSWMPKEKRESHEGWEAFDPRGQIIRHVESLGQEGTRLLWEIDRTAWGGF